MNDVFSWAIETLNASALNGFILGNRFVFPLLEMAHFIGLCLLFGSLIIIDLRLVGMANALPLKHAERFIRFAVIGFAINLTTGVLFIVGDPDRYLVNTAFWLKMGAMALAGLNAAYFLRYIKPQMREGATSADVSHGTHVVAWLSLALWVCVIILGRFIPYVETV